MDNTSSRLVPDGGPLGAYSDAASRLSDAVTLHLTVNGLNAVGQWIAARLSDGGTDGNLYPDKATAIRHQLHETQCAYICIVPEGMPPRDADIFLAYNRSLYDAGLRMPDPNSSGYR